MGCGVGCGLLWEYRLTMLGRRSREREPRWVGTAGELERGGCARNVPMATVAVHHVTVSLCVCRRGLGEQQQADNNVNMRREDLCAVAVGMAAPRAVSMCPQTHTPTLHPALQTGNFYVFVIIMSRSIVVSLFKTLGCHSQYKLLL